MCEDTYADGCIQGLAVILDVFLANIQHVHLRTGDHDTYQGSVFSSSSLYEST